MFRTLRLHCLVGVLAALLLSVGPAWAAAEAGEYVTLRPPVPTATGDQVEVVEVFWYGCPHCWHLEPMLSTWAGTLPKGVAFRRLPATGPRWEPHARAYYAAEALGKLDEFHPALFKAMQVDRRPIFKEDDLVKFAGEIGIDEKAFRDAYESFSVETKVRKAVDLNGRYGIDGVPAVIINGKYRTSPSQTGSKERLIDVLNTLVNQELDVLNTLVNQGLGATGPAGAAAVPAPAPAPAAAAPTGGH